MTKRNLLLTTVVVMAGILLPSASLKAAQESSDRNPSEQNVSAKGAQEKNSKEQSEPSRSEPGAGINAFNFPEPGGPVELRPAHGTRITLNLTENSRAVYEAIARQARISVLFDPDYTPRSISVDLNGLPLQDALKIVAFESRTFWRAVTSDAIFVAADTQVKRHEFEQEIVKTFYFPNITLPTDLQDVVNALRTIVEVRRIQQMPGYQTITVRATPEQMAVAEQMMHDINQARLKTGGQYQVEFKINESNDDKKENPRVFTLLIEPRRVGKLRLGPKIPIQTSDKDKTYIEAGKNIDCEIRYETEHTVSLRLTVEFSDAGQQESGSPQAGRDPLIQQLRMDTSVTLELGTPTVVSSFQDPLSKHNFQIEATAVRTKSKE